LNLIKTNRGLLPSSSIRTEKLSTTIAEIHCGGFPNHSFGMAGLKSLTLGNDMLLG